MLRAFLNTRTPSILTLLGFVICCLMFCASLATARDTAELTRHIVEQLIIWGALAMIWILAFCLCLAQVTRYRRSVSDNSFLRRESR